MHQARFMLLSTQPIPRSKVIYLARITSYKILRTLEQPGRSEAAPEWWNFVRDIGRSCYTDRLCCLHCLDPTISSIYPQLFRPWYFNALFGCMASKIDVFVCTVLSRYNKNLFTALPVLRWHTNNLATWLLDISATSYMLVLEIQHTKSGPIAR